MTNEERLSRYWGDSRPYRRPAVWAVIHSGDHGMPGCSKGSHGHWLPVTPAQHRRLMQHAGADERRQNGRPPPVP